MNNLSAENAKVLQAQRAWNWQWPNERNCWATAPVKRGAPQHYHGPSKRTLHKRATKARNGKH